MNEKLTEFSNSILINNTNTIQIDHFKDIIIFLLTNIDFSYIFKWFKKKKNYMYWRTFNGNRIQIPIKERVENAIIEETRKGNKLKICIGSDSRVKGDFIEFASVIVFLREHKGGFMYICNDRMQQTMTVKERMISEVAKSVEIAYELCDLLDRYKVDLEVHADINTNPNFKSNIALREAMGYILGMGFVFKAKPDAFASSYCADKMI